MRLKLILFMFLSLCLAFSSTVFAEETKKDGASQSTVIQKDENVQTGAETPEKTEVEEESNGVPIAVAPEPSFEFETAVEGSEVLHDFVILNKGDDILKIEKVRTG